MNVNHNKKTTDSFYRSIKTIITSQLETAKRLEIFYP